MNRHDSRLAILVHRNPDFDALGSAVLLRDWYVNEKGYMPENIAIVGKMDFGYLYSKFIKDNDVVSHLDPSWTDYEVCVVDTPTPNFLEIDQKKILKGAREVTIYDHHVNNSDKFAACIKNEDVKINYYVNTDMESCCEYIWSLMSEDARRRASLSALNGCLLGMYCESNCFVTSSNRSLDVATELIGLGAELRCLFRNDHNRNIGMWGKLKYLCKIPGNIMWLKDSKIAIIKTCYSEWSSCNHTIHKDPVNNRAPLYILSIFNQERIKYCKTIHAYLLVYDREWENNSKRYVIVLDLIKWSERRQKALEELGFPIYKAKQYRFYYSSSQSKYFDMCKDIDKALTDTHGDDLIDIYEGKDNI